MCACVRVYAKVTNTNTNTNERKLQNGTCQTGREIEIMKCENEVKNQQIVCCGQKIIHIQCFSVPFFSQVLTEFVLNVELSLSCNDASEQLEKPIITNNCFWNSFLNSVSLVTKVQVKENNQILKGCMNISRNFVSFFNNSFSFLTNVQTFWHVSFGMSCIHLDRLFSCDTWCF